ncbi:WD40-repeat-containing domain protein [Gautieria morchelliformis]|nr:WD40-repeat-containing domain protein [Gautieria morchelliformis]
MDLRNSDESVDFPSFLPGRILQRPTYVMDHNWDDEDEESYAGPDAYIDDPEFDVEDQVMQDDPDITAVPGDDTAMEDDDGLNAQRHSMLEMLDSFISVVPASRSVHADPGGGPTATLASSLTMDQVRLLLAAAQSRSRREPLTVPTDDEDDDPDYIPEDDDDEDRLSFYLPWGRRRPQSKNWFKPVTEPQKAGVELLNGGEFGRLRAKKVVNIRRMLKERELGRKGRGKGVEKDDFARNLTPNSDGTIVANYGSNAYSGQYSAGEDPTFVPQVLHPETSSADSSFYYSCCQDWRLHVYDTKAPLGLVSKARETTSERRRHAVVPEHETTMKTIKTVNAVPGQWTITDSHLSPDNERLIYSSITSTVYMTKTFEPSSPQVPLHFGSQSQRYSWDHDSDYFGIYSCRFSADGNEVIAGGNGREGELRVYDLLADRRTITIGAHADDVNSCCWADTASGNVLISASDDTFLKVWDRRSLGSTQKPSGILVGHTEGITYVSAKGDGRYILSNGKDQAMRLWDLRKMRSNIDFETFRDKHYGQSGFDYRHGYYSKPRFSAHPKDCSVMTYRGHQVLRTLIRCHFSPAETTGANYLYTGSTDGRIHIYSLDGRVVQVLDRRRSLPMSFDPSDRDPGEPLRGRHGSTVCVRDVSWHSQEPVLMSVGWESGHGHSSVARHEWKGIGKLGNGMGKIEDHVERQKLERAERAAKRRARMPGSYQLEDEEV